MPSPTEMPDPQPTPEQMLATLQAQQAFIARLQGELLEKERVIQTLAPYQSTSLRYWLGYRFPRALLDNQLTGPPIQQVRRRLKAFLNEFQLTQHPPRPLHLPTHYARQSGLESWPRISMVTPCRNQGEFIEQTLLSVLGQAYPNLEYVVQDGASVDTTLEVLSRYADRLTHLDSRPDAGQAQAINRGFQKTGGEIMAWLNSDDLLLPGTLHYVASYFASHPEVDVVYGHRVLIDENSQEIGRWLMPEHDDEVLPWADYIPQETLFWRRSVWDKVGGALEEEYQFVLDWDLLLRFHSAGARFARLPRFLGAFRIHTRQKTSIQLHTLGHTEMELLRHRWHGRPVGHHEVRQKCKSYRRQAFKLLLLYRLGWLRH